MIVKLDWDESYPVFFEVEKERENTFSFEIGIMEWERYREIAKEYWKMQDIIETA